MKKILIISLSIFVIVLIILFSFKFYKSSNIFKIIKPSDKSDFIIISSPVKDSQISSPLSITGRARGGWFFEGSFPITLLDSYKNVIAEGHVTAQGEWMTEDFVKFIGNIQFNNYIKGAKGFLVLKKDNPFGLSENDASIEIPITFK